MCRKTKVSPSDASSTAPKMAITTTATAIHYTPSTPSKRVWPLLRLPICAAGICISYVYYGVFQERLLEGQEGQLGASFVLVTSCLTNIFVALLWKWIQDQMQSSKQQQSSTDTTTNTSLHHWLLLGTSGAYVGAMVCSNEAVPYVSYPAVVLGKSCKLIPMMLVGQFLERKLYSRVQWFAALLISAGIVVFQFSRMTKTTTAAESADKDDKDHHIYGTALLVFSLVLDGVLGACQNVLKRSESPYRIPNAVETMLYVNVYALVYLLPWTQFNGQLADGLATLNANVASKLLWVNAAVGCGQIFIFLTITWYSPVMTTTITTTRKFLTILLSVHTFGHVFTAIQWMAVVTVFGGLYLAIVAQQQQTTMKTRQAEEARTDAKAKQE